MADPFDPAEAPDPGKLRAPSGATPIRDADRKVPEPKRRRSLIGGVALPPLAPAVPTGIEAPARMSPAPVADRSVRPQAAVPPEPSPTLVPEHIDELLAEAGLSPTPAPVAVAPSPVSPGPAQPPPDFAEPKTSAAESLPPMLSLPPMGDDVDIPWAESAPKRSMLPWVLGAFAVLVFVGAVGIIGATALVRTLTREASDAASAPPARVERLPSPTPAAVEPLPVPAPVDPPAPAPTVSVEPPAPAPPAQPAARPPAAAVKPKAKAPPPAAVVAPTPAPSDDDPWGTPAAPAPAPAAAPAPAPSGDDPWGSGG